MHCTYALKIVQILQTYIRNMHLFYFFTHNLKNIFLYNNIICIIYSLIKTENCTSTKDFKKYDTNGKIYS